MTPIAIGPHRLLCGDITRGAVPALMGEDLADVVYSDPPWGPGNQQYWHTHNKRGSVPQTDWPGFLRAFCCACAAFARAEAPVFVEMGERWAEDLARAMAQEGLLLQREWSITYGSPPRPNRLLLFGLHDHPIDLGSDRHGPPVTARILEAIVRPGMLVLDPCTGKGMTARNAHRLGGHFRGCELNPRRLAITEAWLCRQVAKAA